MISESGHSTDHFKTGPMLVSGNLLWFVLATTLFGTENRAGKTQMYIMRPPIPYFRRIISVWTVEAFANPAILALKMQKSAISAII